MDWTEIIIEVKRDNAQIAEDVATAVANDGIYIEDYLDLEAQVFEMAHVDLIEEELLQKPKDIVRIHIYVSPDDEAAIIIKQLQDKMFANNAEYKLETKSVKQEDWETSWKQYYDIIEIGERLAVVPSWKSYDGGRISLMLDPGMAFGTGTHETTLMCMQELDVRIKGGERVLDVGTGSGILAIAALLLGAQNATGIDIDKMCVRTAKENAQRNNVLDKFSVKIGDLAQQTSGVYDVITANIIAAAIVRLAPDIPSLLAENGWFIASGIIDERCEEAKIAIEKAGLLVKEIRKKNGWVSILATH